MCGENEMWSPFEEAVVWEGAGLKCVGGHTHQSSICNATPCPTSRKGSSFWEARVLPQSAAHQQQIYTMMKRPNPSNPTAISFNHSCLTRFRR